MNKIDLLFIVCLLALRFLPRKSAKYRYYWVFPLLVFFLAIGIRINSKIESRKRSERIQELESNLNALRDYSSIAKLNILGLPARAGSGIKLSTPISTSLENAIIEKDGKYFPTCSKEAEEKFKQTIKSYPRFPFSYYGLAVCLRSKEDEAWKDYANQAIEIFKKTISIKDHNSGHDQAMKELIRYLEEIN
ncbi:MAG: hypothetical protein K9L86_05745 [Candidatus Omnitrophica bacterium]|nr:hypothetical protein [Candidatus Omnitrophota bacterium]